MGEYKIALNKADMTKPPWKVINQKGECLHFSEVRIRAEAATLATKHGESEYRGWIVVRGTLKVVDSIAQIALIE